MSPSDGGSLPEGLQKKRRTGPVGPGVSTRALLRQVIARVPSGKVITYGQVASAIGLSRSTRLTVWALQRAGRLPWHRVVAAGGRIALRGAEGKEQRQRLRAEGVSFRAGRIRMELHNWVPPALRSPKRAGRPAIHSRRG